MQQDKRIDVLKDGNVFTLKKGSVVALLYAYLSFAVIYFLAYQGYKYYIDEYMGHEILLFSALLLIPFAVSASIRNKINNICYPESLPVVEMLDDDYDISIKDYRIVRTLIFIDKIMYILMCIVLLAVLIILGVFAYENIDNIITVKSLLIFCSFMLVVIYFEVRKRGKE